MTLTRFLWTALITGLLGWALIFAAIGRLATARAGDTWVTVSGFSKHLGTDKKYNEENWGVGIERGISDNTRLLAGTYRNSFRKDTFYLGAGYTPIHLGPVKLGAVAGLFTGYVEDVTFVVMGTAMVEWKGYGLNLLYLPPVKDMDGLVALQFKVQWR